MPHVGGSGNVRVEDVTFKKSRKQSDILNEVPSEEVIDSEAQVPVSTTPEQLKRYCMEQVQLTTNQDKRRVFLAFSRMIDENKTLRDKVKQLSSQLLRTVLENKTVPESRTDSAQEEVEDDE